MREMKDSGLGYLGEIPVHWNAERIKNHLRFSPDKNPGEAIILSLYREHGIVPKDSRDDNHNVTSEDTSNYRYVREGDVVVNKMKAWQGSMGVSDYEGVVSPAYYVYRFTTDAFDKQYLHYLLRSKCYADEFRRLSGGIRIGQWDLPKAGFETTYVAVPPKDEQTAIADTIDICLEKVDTLIANVQAQIEKLKAYKQSVITEVVTKGLDPTVPMKDSGVDRLDRIPMHWHIMKQTMLTTRIGDGLHGTPEFDDSSNIFFINGNNLGEKYITVRENTKSVLPSEYEKYRLDLNDRTLLISLNGTIGSISRYNGEIVVFGKSAGYIIVKDNINIDYLSYYLRTRCVKEIFELSFAGTTIKNLSLETLRNLRVCVPPHEEQDAIVVYLDEKCSQLDRLIALKQSKIDKLEQYKKSLIYEYVTGKKEVS